MSDGLLGIVAAIGGLPQLTAGQNTAIKGPSFEDQLTQTNPLAGVFVQGGIFPVQYNPIKNEALPVSNDGGLAPGVSLVSAQDFGLNETSSLVPSQQQHVITPVNPDSLPVLSHKQGHNFLNIANAQHRSGFSNQGSQSVTNILEALSGQD